MQLREDAGLTWGRISGEGATEEGKEASNIQKEKGARFSDNLNERRRQVMEGRKGGREEGRRDGGKDILHMTVKCMCAYIYTITYI